MGITWKACNKIGSVRKKLQLPAVNVTLHFGLPFVCFLNAGTWDIAEVKSCSVTFGTLSELSRELGE